jgi:hypothetical protein
MSRVALLHPELRPGDVLVGERAFGTFAHLALLAGRGIHGVFRMSQRRVVDFTSDRPRPPRWNTPRLSVSFDASPRGFESASRGRPNPKP